MIYEVKERNDELIEELLNVWEGAVINTHLFLSSSEIEKIKKYVPVALKEVEHLIVFKNDDKKFIAFMGINDKKLEMLFVKNDERKKGIGKKLLNYGIEKYGVNDLTVNEQNKEALTFYKHMGFKAYKRSKKDEQGGPYPILYMKL